MTRHFRSVCIVALSLLAAALVSACGVLSEDQPEPAIIQRIAAGAPIIAGPFRLEVNRSWTETADCETYEDCDEKALLILDIQIQNDGGAEYRNPFTIWAMTGPDSEDWEVGWSYLLPESRRAEGFDFTFIPAGGFRRGLIAFEYGNPFRRTRFGDDEGWPGLATQLSTLGAVEELAIYWDAGGVVPSVAFLRIS